MRHGKKRKREQSLLDLPIELLVEIFALSASSDLPQTCKYLYQVCHAQPRDDGPPLWLQHKFIRNTNPTLVYAVNKCLRRRFFGPETLKAYLPELSRTGELVNLSVPLRLIKPTISTRELLLCTELFLNGIHISRVSCNKGLIFLAAQSTVDAQSLFWKYTRNSDFDPSAVAQAFRVSAKKRSFKAHGSFPFLHGKFGINEAIGAEMYEMAARRKDQEFIALLQRLKVRPNMAALRLMT